MPVDITRESSDRDAARQAVREELRGQPGLLRVIFTGSPLEALAGDGLTIDGVHLSQTEEAIPYSYSEVGFKMCSQTPVSRTVIHHAHTRPGMLLTLASAPFTVPSSGLLATLASTRRRILSVVSLVCAALDERIADRAIGEYAYIEQTGQPPAIVDVASEVRPFNVSAEYVQQVPDILAGLADGVSVQDHSGPLELYLQAVTAPLRRTAAGFILLASVVDQLTGSGAFKPQAIQNRLAAAQEPVPLSRVKEVATIRARVTHHGTAALGGNESAWYDLEWWARVLLRARLGITLAFPVATANDTLWQEVTNRDIEWSPDNDDRPRKWGEIADMCSMLERLGNDEPD